MIRRILLALLLAASAVSAADISRTPLILGGGGGGASNNGSTSFGPDGFGSWTIVSQGVDQDVTNSTVQVNSNLCLNVPTATTWEMQYHLKYSGNGATPGTTPGLAYNWTIPLSSLGTFFTSHGETVDAAGATTSGDLTTGSTPTITLKSGTLADLARPLHVSVFATASFGPLVAAGGNVCLTFANQTAGVGLITRLWARSSLAYRQMAP